MKLLLGDKYNICSVMCGLDYESGRGGGGQVKGLNLFYFYLKFCEIQLLKICLFLI